METVKKYWWLFFVLPIAGYFAYKFITSRINVHKEMERVREAKAEKKAIQDAINDLENVREN